MHHEWDAARYHRVAAPQTAWGERILAALDLRGDERAVDLGCGTGRLTSRLVERLPAGRVVALDRSMNMLRVARTSLGGRATGRLTFVQAALPDIPMAGWADLVFSTATFHWVLDHPTLFAAIFDALRPGGRLVAQCGGAGNLHRTHVRAVQLASSPRFARWFTTWAGPWEFAGAETTRERLKAAGFVEVATGIEEAPARFADAKVFREFIETVVLRPFLARIDDSGCREAFLQEMVAMSENDTPPFVLDYRRLNLRATRPR